MSLRPPVHEDQPLPPLTRAASRYVDATAVSRYGIPSIVLMENAAIGLASHALSLARERGLARALVMCGPGNNGGDGYAAARHLHNEGMDVTLAPITPPRAGTDAAINAEICRRMALPRLDMKELDRCESNFLILDAILGTGLEQAPRGVTADAIRLVNELGERRAVIVAADVPSGLDADTGEPLGDAVRAELTVTFGAMKTGLMTRDAHHWTGRVEVVGIGVPRELVLEAAHGV